LVFVPSDLGPDRGWIYAVTTWHVACRHGASVLRINRCDQGVEIFSFGPEDWIFDPQFDIAVIHVSIVQGIHKYAKLSTADGFVLQHDLEEKKIGAGEDVFMIGRFVDHDGGPVNQPAVRFGNISVMPSRIKQPNGKMAYSYCIDLRSRSGYSGSPVFLYRLPGYDLEETLLTSDGLLRSGISYLKLLGIHWGQFPERWELIEGLSLEAEPSAAPLIREGAYVQGLSGMTCVLPAWHILDVLNLARLQQQRMLGERTEIERSGIGLPEPKAG
jgi:hypothetical protein